jgi:hypothetical protein
LAFTFNASSFSAGMLSICRPNQRPAYTLSSYIELTSFNFLAIFLSQANGLPCALHLKRNRATPALLKSAISRSVEISPDSNN